MKDFSSRVAVITGASSGIGRAISERCAREGMRVVLAGININNLLIVENELRSKGATVISIQTDVSKRSDIENLAQRTLDEFGAVHLLVNNAGVGAGLSPWRSTWNDWEWVLNVNMWGVIYGVKIFTPIMLKQNTESYIVNNASVAGLITFHPSAPYTVSKHAVVALSENLYHWLRHYSPLVKVSVLCSGPVESRIMESNRNRPIELKNKPVEIDDAEKGYINELNKLPENVTTAESIADNVFQAIQQEKFYIFTHASGMSLIQQRLDDLINESNPQKPH